MQWASTPEICESWQLGSWIVTLSKRATDGLMGRFGGGWNWKLGFQAGGNTVIISLLIAELRIER